MQKLLLSLLLLLATSCVWRDPVLDEYVAATPESRWRGPEVAAIPDPPLCVLPDHPLSVAEMLDLALRNNPTTTRTWAVARAAGFGWRESQSSLYPSLNFEEEFTHTDESSISGNPSNGDAFTNQDAPNNNSFRISKKFRHFNSFTSWVSLQYLLLDFGGRDAVIQSTLQALFEANWMHNRSLQDVTIQVLDSYYAYINALELLRARLDDFKDSTANLELAERQLQLGVSTRVDFLQAKSNNVNVQLSVEELKGQVEVTKGALAVSLGLPAHTQFEVEPLPQHFPLDTVTQHVEDLLETAKVQRPDLAAAYANYRREEANVQAATSAALPTLSLQSNYYHNSFPSNTRFNNHQYATSVVLSVPIFNGFFYTNNRRQAQERVVAAHAAMQEKELSVSLEVVSSYYAYKTAVQTLKYSEEYLKFAEESYKATGQGYDAGTQTFVDILLVQAVLANARAKVVASRTDWVTALANLNYSIGVL